MSFCKYLILGTVSIILLTFGNFVCNILNAFKDFPLDDEGCENIEGVWGSEDVSYWSPEAILAISQSFNILEGKNKTAVDTSKFGIYAMETKTNKIS